MPSPIPLLVYGLRMGCAMVPWFRCTIFRIGVGVVVIGDVLVPMYIMPSWRRKTADGIEKQDSVQGLDGGVLCVFGR